MIHCIETAETQSSFQKSACQRDAAKSFFSEFRHIVQQSLSHEAFGWKTMRSENIQLLFLTLNRDTLQVLGWQRWSNHRSPGTDGGYFPLAYLTSTKKWSSLPPSAWWIVEVRIVEYADYQLFTHSVIFIDCDLTLMIPSGHMTSILLSILERDPPLLLSWRFLHFFPPEGLFGSCSWSDMRSKVRDVHVYRL